jgi:hypothetical protein
MSILADLIIKLLTPFVKPVEAKPLPDTYTILFKSRLECSIDKSGIESLLIELSAGKKYVILNNAGVRTDHVQEAKAVIFFDQINAIARTPKP